MSMLSRIEPRKRRLDVKMAPPSRVGMEDFFGNFPSRRWLEMFEPLGVRWPTDDEYGKSFSLDVIDRDKELVVRGELPGVEKDDIEIALSGDRLSIEAERKFEEEYEKDAFYRHEVGYGQLMRTVLLPVPVDADHVRAELKDGILEVVLPKKEPSERHTVKVA